MSKARITYRFEHPRRVNGQAAAVPADRVNMEEENQRTSADIREHVEFPVADEPIVLEEKPPALPARIPTRRVSGDYPYDYGAWYDPADSETEELERMIRSTGTFDPISEKKRPALQGSEDTWIPKDREAETGYWRYAEEELRADAPLIRRRPPQEGPAWWKVAGSVVGAIATGLLFGTFLLNLFTSSAPGEAPPQTADGPLITAPAASGEEVLTAPGTQEGSAAQGGAAGEAAVSSLDLPERRVWLLQNGVFDTLAGARTLADDMKSKGFAGTIEEGEDFYVYAGVTTDRDQALRTGLTLQSSGIEVYVKPYDLPEVSEVRLAPDTAAALGEYIAKGGSLVQMIGDLTLIHLDGDDAVAPEKSTIEKLKSEHFALTEKSTQTSAGLSSGAQPVLKRMDDAIRNAVMAMEEYAAHPDHTYLWSAQGALIDYLIAEKRLLTEIAVK